MSDRFGSPNERDDVAWDERVVESAAQEQADFLNQVMDERKRAVGSKRVPKQEADLEWEMLRSDPQAVADFYQGKTLEEAVNDAWDREKRRGSV